jgi:hypothetical protein
LKDAHDAVPSFGPVNKPLGIGSAAVCVGAIMGHSKGKDNVKKRAARRKKMERLRNAKQAPTKAK